MFEAERPSLVPYAGPLRRLPRRAGLGLEDLPGALRQQQILGQRQRRRTSGRGSCLCRSHRVCARTAGSSASMPAPSGAARRSTIPGTMCRFWPANPARCATARRSRTGCCRPPWSGSGASCSGSDDGDRQMVEILAAVLTDGLPAVEAACAEALDQGVHSADVILNILARRRDPARRSRSSPRTRCA